MRDVRAAIFIAITILLLPGFLSAAEAEQTIDLLFEKANVAHSRGDYKTAIAKYEEITNLAGNSGGVLFNLANSYAQDGRIGKAIVNYERALLTSSSDPDIVGNLELVKKESGLFLREQSRFERIFFSLSMNQWATLCLVSLVVLAIFQITTLVHPITRKNTAVITGLCCIILCLFLIGSYASYQKFNPSIVISPEARLLISPFDSATSIGTIQEGRRVYPVKTHKAYTYVIDETDRKGWITNKSIEAVCNPPKEKRNS